MMVLPATGVEKSVYASCSFIKAIQFGAKFIWPLWRCVHVIYHLTLIGHMAAALSFIIKPSHHSTWPVCRELPQ